MHGFEGLVQERQRHRLTAELVLLVGDKPEEEGPRIDAAGRAERRHALLHRLDPAFALAELANRPAAEHVGHGEPDLKAVLATQRDRGFRLLAGCSRVSKQVLQDSIPGERVPQTEWMRHGRSERETFIAAA